MSNIINLENLITQFDEKQKEKKIVIIAGKRGQKKTFLLGKIWGYNFNNYILEGNQEIGFLTKFNKYLQRQQQKKANKIDYLHSYYCPIKKLDIRKISNDLNSCLMANLRTKNLHRFHYFDFLKKGIDYLLIKWVSYKIRNIRTSFARIAFYEKNKSLWPILTTVTSIGTTIGTPVLSLILFRQDQLAELVGKQGIQILLGICGVLIVTGVFSVFWYLITTVLNQRKASFNVNLVQKYEKLCKKYFYVPKNKSDRKLMWKFAIQSSINYFYDDIDFSSEDYPAIVTLMHTLKNLNNNIIGSINIQEEYQVSNIFAHYNGDKNNSYVYSVGKNYKDSGNHVISNLLLQVMSKNLKVNISFLYRRNFLFAKFINSFIEYSHSSWQIFQFLEDLKQYVGEIPNLYKDKNTLNYFLHIIPFLILKSINLETYKSLISELKNSLNVPKEIQKNFDNLKFDFLIEESWNHFKTSSLIFNIGNIFEKNKKINEIVATFVEKKSSVENIENRKTNLLTQLQSRKFIESKNCASASDSYKIIHMINDYEEVLLFFNLAKVSEDPNFEIMKSITEIKKIGFKSIASYIVIMFFDTTLFLQKIHNDYEVFNFEN